MTSPKAGDIYVQQLQEENEYWQRVIRATPALRDQGWKPDFSSAVAYQASLKRHREDLRRMLGLIEIGPEQLAVQREVLAAGPVEVDDLTITLKKNFQARALLLVPGGKVSRVVIAIPDAQESPAGFIGIVEGQKSPIWLKTLLGKGIAVCVPITVERKTDYPFGQRWGVNRRQLLYRLGFIVGRTLVGMEVQQVLALRDYLEKRFGIGGEEIDLLGLRQGGMTALYAGAVDGQFGIVSVVDYFQQPEARRQEPADRIIYGELKEFGDAEIAGLIAPGRLEVVYTTDGATPKASVATEAQRAGRFYQALGKMKNLRVVEASNADAGLDQVAKEIPKTLGRRPSRAEPVIQLRLSGAAITKRRNEHFENLHAYLQQLDEDSDGVRTKHWDLLNTPPSERDAKAAELRTALGKLVGEIPLEKDHLDPHTRLIAVTGKFTAYDVLLDVLPGVHAYGQLLIPRQRRGRLPVVICQHGLGGRPTDITGIGRGSEPIYHALGAHLASLGYVVFAPYITVPIRQEILVNPLVQKAAAVGMMRTSLEVAKLHRIVDFLQTLPFVDGGQIGYYGLSYGGYSAIWMPPLEPRIKLNIISGHFNDWRTKITSEESPESYLRYQDADFYNWNVLDRFTHVELIAAMYPRPVCVEFGEHDPTTTPAWHARAWKEVMEWATAWGLEGLDARVVEAHYEGIHEIHGIRTIAFLNRWLRPDLPDGRNHSYNLLPANIQLQHFTADGGLTTGQGAEVPLAQHELDSGAQTRIEGRFYVSRPYPTLTGFALKLSRVGHPGDLIVRLGSTPGGDELGEGRIASGKVGPLFDLWYAAGIKPVRLDPSKLYYFEVTASSGRTPEDYYIVYGPQPLGGTDEPGHFGLSYQVIGAGEPASLTHHYERFGFMRPMLAPYTDGPAIDASDVSPRQQNEIAVEAGWSVHMGNGSDEVMKAASDDLSQFLQNALNIPVKISTTKSKHQIHLEVAPAAKGVHTSEGYRITVSQREIKIEGTTSRGVMRGVYAIEDGMRTRRGPYLEKGVITRNMRFSPRITTAVHPQYSLYRETSFPLPYTDGLLQRISHSGFNAVWVWLNTEEATQDSKIYPELSDPEAATRLARLKDLTRRAHRYGIDTYIYLGTGYNHHIPASFFQKYPEARGYGWGPPLNTSNEKVRRYYTETVGTIFHQVPDLKGIVVIYDSEGFWYTGNSERSLLEQAKECPRCSHFSQQEIAAQLLTTLDRAMHRAGGPDKQLIAWNYNVASQWILKLIPLLPHDIVIQGDFDKGMIAEKDGIRERTGDYNISNLGPPELFLKEYEAAREHELGVMAKTEHAVSQEFIFVPYIPCMGQWYRRIDKMREYDLLGWFGNWNHYGYTPSIPATLINRMSSDPAPKEEAMLQELAERKFGSRATPYVVRAWHDYSRGIREYPYSDFVARIPGPLQKGPSQPLFLDPIIKGFGPWRSWQNDLDWTKPWGPAITAKYLGQLEQLYSEGNAELKSAEGVAPASYRPALEAEWRVGRTIQSSVETVLHLIDWIQTRNDFYAARSVDERQRLAEKLEAIALAERGNTQEILPLLDSDSRLGYAAVGDDGLFTPALVRWKVGEVDDVLLRQIPEELKRLNAGY
ncbi:MAG: glycoside hydrolase family 20 zincin-like fold domain-containing protein [Acidobacteriaceae bacterium]